MTDTNVRAIAREVADEISRKIQKTRYLMSRPELAEALGFQKQSSAIDKIISDPSFPRPIDLPDGCRKKYHKRRVVADPSAYVKVFHPEAHKQQHAEGPCEYRREVFPDDVVPEMFLHIMV